MTDEDKKNTEQAEETKVEETKVEESATKEVKAEEKPTEATQPDKEKTSEQPAAGKAAPKKKAANQAKYVRTAKGKKRLAAKTPRGKAFIHASVNNTIVTITDPNGNTLTWASAGHVGFRGPKKATPYAASKIIDKIAEKAEDFGVKDLHVVVTGIGSGRDSAIRSLNAKGFNILSIMERTPVPHNGCRPKRPRRV